MSCPTGSQTPSWVGITRATNIRDYHNTKSSKTLFWPHFSYNKIKFQFKSFLLQNNDIVQQTDWPTLSWKSIINVMNPTNGTVCVPFWNTKTVKERCTNTQISFPCSKSNKCFCMFFSPLDSTVQLVVNTLFYFFRQHDLDAGRLLFTRGLNKKTKKTVLAWLYFTSW